ncbi:tetratricopeptide repeat protein, partial [Sphingobacterium mizutaii]
MILPFQGFSQRTAFEKKYAAVRSELLATNYEEALRIADSLEQISTTETTKIRSKSLLALVHQSVGTYSIAINYAKQADQLSDLVGLSDFEASSALVLASIYRDIGIQEEVSRYIQRAKDNINSVKDSLVRNQLDIWVLQEEAYQYIHNKRYADALDCMNQAINKKGYIDFKNPRSLLIRSKNYLIIAQCHKEMGNYEESLTYLKMVMDEVYGFEHIIKPFTFQFLADVYFNLGQLENARKYLDLVIPYITGS